MSGHEVPNTYEIDARGLKCPMPVLLTKKALRNAPMIQRFKLICTDPMSQIDVRVLISHLQLHLLRDERRGSEFIFEFERRSTDQ